MSSPTPYETPEQIAAAIGRGDSKAETVLFKRYYQPTLFLLERKTGDPELARDLCQEAFCILIERLRSTPLSEPDKMVGFLHNIAFNLHIGEIRKAKRRNTFTNQAITENIADNSNNPYRRLLEERTGQAVRLVIESMSNARDRKLLYGFYIQQKDKEEVCAELDLGHRHFDRVLFRAKERFKELVLHGKGRAGAHKSGESE